MVLLGRVVYSVFYRAEPFSLLVEVQYYCTWYLFFFSRYAPAVVAVNVYLMLYAVY